MISRAACTRGASARTASSVRFATTVAVAGSTSSIPFFDARADRDAVQLGIPSRHLDRDRIDVDGEHRLEAELRCGDREDTRSAADVEQGTGWEIGEELEAESRRRVGARAERATRVDDDGDCVARRGFPRRADPQRTDTNTMMKRAPTVFPAVFDRSHADRFEDLARRASPTASVYATRTTPSEASCSSNPSGNSSIMVARASSARSAGTNTETRFSGSAP